jgi:S-(hydroxymethyl)glutathione dehydrogenase/alcohol dehydrogenase
LVLVVEMRAAVLWAPDELRVETVTLPSPKPGDVLVRIVGSGVCGSDVHVLHGELPFYECPIVPGHEAAGVVEEVGSAVTAVAPGDHVILGWIPGCGNCPTCWNGQPDRCLNLGFGGAIYDGETRITVGDRPVGTMAHIGGFADYALVGERTCIKIREDAPLERVCLIGCGVATGYGSVFGRAKVQPGSTALVIGCGGVGLNVIQFLGLAGATMIIAADRVVSKLELARTMGATHTIDAGATDVVEEVRELTRGAWVDHAFEVISTARTIRQAYDATRLGGQVTVVGVAPRGEEITLPASVRKVLGGGGPAGPQWATTPMLVDLYMSGTIKLDELVSRERPLAEINEAFADLASGTVARTVLVSQG